MGLKRVIDTSFWTDEKVERFSVEDRDFMFYLLTNPSTNQLGIYAFSRREAAMRLGYDDAYVEKLLRRFEDDYEIILVSKKTNEVAIKNYLKYSVVKGGQPMFDCLMREAKKIKDASLVDRVFAHVKDSHLIKQTAKDVINAYYSATNVEASGENYGYHRNIRLTKEQYDGLKQEFGEKLDEELEQMSAYMAANEKDYADHYAAVRSWMMRENQFQSKKQSAKSSGSFDAIDFANNLNKELGA